MYDAWRCQRQPSVCAITHIVTGSLAHRALRTSARLHTHNSSVSSTGRLTDLLLCWCRHSCHILAMATRRGRPSYASTASSSSTSSIPADGPEADCELQEIAWMDNGDDLADLESSWDSQRLRDFQEAPFSGTTRRRHSFTSVRRFLRRQASGQIKTSAPEQLRPANWTRSWILVTLLLFLLGCFILLDGLFFGHIHVDISKGVRWLRNISW